MSLLQNMIVMDLSRSQIAHRLETEILDGLDCPKNWVLNDDLTSCVPNPIYYTLTCKHMDAEVFIENAILDMFDMTWGVRLNDARCSSNRVDNMAGSK